MALADAVARRVSENNAAAGKLAASINSFADSIRRNRIKKYGKLLLQQGDLSPEALMSFAKQHNLGVDEMVPIVKIVGAFRKEMGQPGTKGEIVSLTTPEGGVMKKLVSREDLAKGVLVTPPDQERLDYRKGLEAIKQGAVFDELPVEQRIALRKHGYTPPKMTYLKNTKTGEIIAVPADRAEALRLSGNYKDYGELKEIEKQRKEQITKEKERKSKSKKESLTDAIKRYNILVKSVLKRRGGANFIIPITGEGDAASVDTASMMNDFGNRDNEMPPVIQRLQEIAGNKHESALMRKSARAALGLLQTKILPELDIPSPTPEPDQSKELAAMAKQWDEAYAMAGVDVRPKEVVIEDKKVTLTPGAYYLYKSLKAGKDLDSVRKELEDFKQNQAGKTTQSEEQTVPFTRKKISISP